MSTREEIAQRLAEVIVAGGLTQPFGGEVHEQLLGRRTVYSVAFSRPRALDGVIDVYGETWIRVASRGPAGQGSQVFATVEDAERFVRLAFVEGDVEGALQVPRRR